jgi:hypothetical protein
MVAARTSVSDEDDGDVGDVAPAEGAGGLSVAWASLVGAEPRRLMLSGLEVCLAFSYKPQALQIILPLMSRLQSGVVLVLQFLEIQSACTGRGETHEQSCPVIGLDRAG